MKQQQTDAPSSWLETLERVLDLEQARGFNNRAVTGGVDRFIERWLDSLNESLANAGAERFIRPGEYAGMSPDERQRWAAALRARLLPADDSRPPPPPTDKLDPGPPDSPPRVSPARDTGARAAAAGQSAPGEVLVPSGDKPPIKTNAKTNLAKTNAARIAAASATAGSTPAGLTIDAPVDRLRGVDAKLSARLERLGVRTIRDLLYLFPRRHSDYSQIVRISEVEPDVDCTVIGQVWESREVSLGKNGRLKATEAVLSDETGNIKVIWFGQRYIARSLKTNSRLAISGKASGNWGRLVFESPEYEPLEPGQTPMHTARLVPVYPLTAGLTARNLRRLVWQALSQWLGGVGETLDDDLRKRVGVMPLAQAIMQAHYPDDAGTSLEARRRLAFEELFTLQLAVLARRRRWSQGLAGVTVKPDPNVIEKFISSLPFSLTGAQRRCTDEILADLKRGSPPMNRLLQGEVGSGKTVVVLAALMAAAAAGYQGAIMVPTEVLAEQHFSTISGLLGGLARPVQDGNRVTAYLEALGRPVSVGLLTGSTRQRARRELTELSGNGQLDLLVGTQALIQSGVEMPQLALAVMDEQHRFGVMQRSALRQKGVENPHTLVMSATPIPRTLSLTLYGDLDISIIDELPPGRQTIKTTWLGPERRDAAHGFVRRQVRDGRQAFVIYPLVEESDQVDAKAAVEDHRRLSEDVFPDLRVGLLHGRMSPKDKEKVMRQFRDGELDVLVSTAVVEVGIDVPNATVMLVEGADRFGLSQLHQFRGRVGRGEHQSYCILLCDSPSTVAKERLSALEQIDDGFRLAEVDLELRGPGDFFGTRQSGLPDLRMASLSDRDLLNAARREASQLMESDPELAAPEHAALSRQVARFLDHASGEVS